MRAFIISCLFVFAAACNSTSEAPASTGVKAIDEVIPSDFKKTEEKVDARRFELAYIAAKKYFASKNVAMSYSLRANKARVIARKIDEGKDIIVDLNRNLDNTKVTVSSVTESTHASVIAGIKKELEAFNGKNEEEINKIIAEDN